MGREEVFVKKEEEGASSLSPSVDGGGERGVDEVAEFEVVGPEEEEEAE
jgi:hypothetical protein